MRGKKRKRWRGLKKGGGSDECEEGRMRERRGRGGGWFIKRLFVLRPLFGPYLLYNPISVSFHLHLLLLRLVRFFHSLLRVLYS